MSFFLQNENDLISALSNGSEDAFREIVVYYRPYLLSYILTFTKSREKAEEVVQDIFLQIWISRDTLKAVKNFRSYLFVMSKNMALNALRSIVRERIRKTNWEQQNNEDWVTLPDYKDDSLPGILDQAILQLPSQQQKVWILVRKEGFSHAETALKMGISRETVKKYIQYATQSISDFLRQHMELLMSVFISFLSFLKKI